MRTAMFIVTATAVALCAVSTTQATWSIVVADTRTGQVAVGSATCLEFFDLQRFLPVIIRNRGAGAAQSFIDGSGQNRRLMWDALRAGIDPAEILVMLRQQDSGHETRQYGIVDVQGRAVTFSGTQNGRFAAGLTGRVGNLVYAIQGNVLTGQPVLDAAEMAFVSTTGGLPEKLMAAMEAARAMGGDGRCSCPGGPYPDSCGSPPPDFEKSAHIGFMVISRRGDRLGRCDSSRGCANGDYYMAFNVADQRQSDPDPVFQLRELFDEWRAMLIGVPDGVTSIVTPSATVMVNDGASQSIVDIEVLDWRSDPAVGITAVIVAHTPASAGSSSIGKVMDLGNGQYSLAITAGTTPGLDIIRVTVEHSEGIVRLAPFLELRIAERGDMNANGVLDAFDIEPFLLALFDADEYERRFPENPRVQLGDFNLDGQLDSFDIEGFLAALFGP